MPYVLHTPSIGWKVDCTWERNWGPEAQDALWGRSNYLEEDGGEKEVRDAWKSLAPTQKQQSQEDGISLEITVWILNKFDFTWFFVYPSKYQILGTACEPGLLWHLEADVSPINKNVKSFQKGTP